MTKKEQEIKIIKNDAYRKLENLSKEKGKSVREMIMDENAAEFGIVVELFYNELPRHTKWLMSREKFKALFLRNREMMLNMAGL